MRKRIRFAPAADLIYIPAMNPVPAIYNEPLAAALVGLLLAISSGVRITLPLLAVNLLAFYHEITLPQSMAWLGTEPTVIILSVACAAETLVHFIPVAGTYLRAAATPLAFVAGTLLMAVPLGNENPLCKWAVAGVVGGGAAMLTHLGVTGARALGAPANVASLGLFGLIWNVGEFVLSLAIAGLGGLCVFFGWIIGAFVLVALVIAAVVAAVVGLARVSRSRVAATA